MMLLSQTGIESALLALVRLQGTLAAAAFDDIAPGLRSSFSGGVTELTRADRLEDATERTDRATYVARNAGRCRTVVA